MNNLRSEEEIITSWGSLRTTPLVSVCCTTYNHVRFIEGALKGFLEQKTNFPIEILIHDDASTDGTTQIIRKYQLKYPHIIKPIYQQENQFSKDRRINPKFNYPRAKGDYIALCEGDDYWIDENKLRRQVEILNENPGLDMVFHSALIYNSLTKQEKTFGIYKNCDGVVNIGDILTRRYGQIPTASTMVRIESIKIFLDFIDKRPWLTVGDIYIHFFGAKKGGAYFINRPMSVYRQYVDGSWTSQFNDQYKFRMNHLLSCIKSYEDLNSITDFKYKESIDYANRNWVKKLLKDETIPSKEKHQIYKDFNHYLYWFEKFAYLSLIKFPFLYKYHDLKNKLRRLRGNYGKI